ncbi:MAG TPA: hypothetical protein VGI10_05310 [Polyangiaceae bacterium]|jgi:hypothetical protein
MKQSIVMMAAGVLALTTSACVSIEDKAVVWNGLDGVRVCRIPAPPDKRLAVQPSTVPPPSPEMINTTGPTLSLAPGAASAPKPPAMNVAEQMYRDEVAMYRLCEARANHWIDTRTYRCELERFAHGADGESAWKGCISSPARESDGRQ